MKLLAGDTITIEIDSEILSIKIEDASKSESLSGRVESVLQGKTYNVGQIYDFDRDKVVFKV